MTVVGTRTSKLGSSCCNHSNSLAKQACDLCLALADDLATDTSELPNYTHKLMEFNGFIIELRFIVIAEFILEETSLTRHPAFIGEDYSYWRDRTYKTMNDMSKAIQITYEGIEDV
ncbi:hypothetical protein CR513_41008, partial [Mucuna pruriens]